MTASRAPSKERKSEYAKYLESTVWKRLRKAALERDGHACQGCGKRATQVHHSQYPKVLGEEKLEWLHSVCVGCHGLIHSLVAKERMPLRKATFWVLEGHAAPAPKKKRKQPKRKQPKRKPRPQHVADDARKKQRLSEGKQRLHDENESLRRTLADNRARRERRKSYLP